MDGCDLSLFYRILGLGFECKVVVTQELNMIRYAVCMWSIYVFI